MKSFFKETPLNSFPWNYYQRWRIVLARAVFNIAACTLRSMMIIIPTSSICDLFQTSSKKACEKHPQWTGQPHLAKGFISGRNFHNIRRKLDKNVLIRIIPTKGCEQNNNNKLESLNSPGKGLHQQEKLSQFQKKIAYKRIMDCVNKTKEHCFIF